MLSEKPLSVTFVDNLSGGQITLEYNAPSTEDRIQYSNSIVARRGKKIEMFTGQARAKFGAKILCGIKDGDFVKGDGKALSSNAASPDYDPGWKEFITKYAPDVVQMLAMHVFENALSLAEVDEEDPT
jgi:hypothetical protein